MMKIEMKHHPGVTVLQNSEELFPTEVHGQNLAHFSGNSVTDSHAPLVSKQARTRDRFCVSSDGMGTSAHYKNIIQTD